MNVGAILSIIEHSLSIADMKEKRKYLDRVLYLKKKWREEKEREDFSQYHLDLIELELLDLFSGISTNISGEGKNTNP